MPIWVPVLDVRGGTAVRAEGGERDHYRPLTTIFHPSPDPRRIVAGLVKTVGPGPVYLADLDAIGGATPDFGLVRDLAKMGAQVWVDAGVRSAEQVRPLGDAGAEVVVAGLETLEGPEELAGCVKEAGPDHLAFSLDLKDGRPLVPTRAAWGSEQPVDLAERAFGCGLLRLIVLDLARVGTGRGLGTLSLVRGIRRRCPGLRCVAGGGVSGIADLRALFESGADGVLVGSALHDGRLTAQALDQAASARSSEEAGPDSSKGMISSR